MRNKHLANITLIDDDSDDRQLFKEALSAVSEKSVLNCYSSCTEAILEMKKNLSERPHVLFLDLMLPGVDGYECVQWIKDQPAFADMPIVVLSSNISPSNMDRLYNLGVSYFISKPPTFAKLKTVIDKMVNTPSIYANRSRESFFVNEHD